MSDSYLPEEIPTIYRGGSTMTFLPHEVRIDNRTGYVKPTHGVSVDSVAEDVARFGGAHRVVAIPQGLTIVQRGRRPTHFEVVPKQPMPPAEYQYLLNQVELEREEV